MPDWTYQTCFRPLLFRLPPLRARALTLDALALLGTHRLGPALIGLMGHTQPPADLQQSAFGLIFAAPLGIGADLADNERAVAALSRFGVGYVEVGPAALAAHAPTGAPMRQAARETLVVGQNGTVAASDLAGHLPQRGTVPAHIAVRLGHAPEATALAAAHERVTVLAHLAAVASFFTLTPPPAAWNAADWHAHLAIVLAAAAAQECPLLVGVPSDANEQQLAALVEPALGQGAAGIVICAGVAGTAGTRLLGVPAQAAALEVLQRIRQRWGAHLPVVVAGGACAPAHVLALRAAGATLVQLDAGLVFAGPGLPKRSNEALRFAAQPRPRPPFPRSLAALMDAGWLWMLLLGLGMLVGGALALAIAATRVVLPYDEAFVALTRAELAAINPRLLPFMAHDRAALAGTMISIGVLYSQLAAHALRRREHWALVTIGVSASVGFASFFLFLGYGYFDPLHALVSLLLLPLFLVGLRPHADAPPFVAAPDLYNDRFWHMAQWGQLGAVLLAVGLVGAGITIMTVGVTTVFVPEDLAFLCTTRAGLTAANEQVVALIAHDRAGFGGALLSNGLGALLLALWGIRRGARWVWWTLLLAGAPGFAVALGVHWVVGYNDWWHLAPGLLGLGLFGATLVLLFPYLCDRVTPRA